MSRRNVCAAFLSPNGIFTNSNKLNGVMTAVLVMSEEKQEFGGMHKLDQVSKRC